MYTPIPEMMTAEEAADALVKQAQNISSAIKRRDNVFFPNRATSIQALLKLLAQYVEQPEPGAFETWISPKEQMPTFISGPRRFDTKVEVEVQCKRGIEKRNCFVGGTFDDDDIPGLQVIAWRPLPLSL